MDINQVNLRTLVCLGNEEVGHTQHVNEEWQQLGCLTAQHLQSILPTSNSLGDDSKRCQQKFYSFVHSFIHFTVAPGYYMAALVLSGIFPRDRPTPIGNYSEDPKT